MRRLSVAEFERLPEEEGYRLELVRGMVVREPAPGEVHAVVDLNLAAAMHGFVREQRLGRVLTNAAFVLNGTPPTVRVPDIAFVQRSRLHREPQPEILHMAPDLAVEILSPRNRKAEIRDKLADYFGAGVRLVWIVDPARHTVEVHRQSGTMVLTGRDILHGEDVIPGFTLPVKEIFRYE